MDEAPRVLVVDDEAPIRLLCRVNLEAERMMVLEAADGPSGPRVKRRRRAAGCSSGPWSGISRLQRSRHSR